MSIPPLRLESQPLQTEIRQEEKSCVGALCDLVQRVALCVFTLIRQTLCCCCSCWEVTPLQVGAATPSLSAEELERRADLERAAFTLWQQQIEANFTESVGTDPQCVNLASSTQPAFSGRCVPVNNGGTFPHIGYYDRDYEFADNLLLVKLPFNQLAAFPQPIRERFGNLAPENLEILFMIQSDQTIGRAVQDRPHPDHRNIIFHTMAFPQLREDEDIWRREAMGAFSFVGAQGINVGHGGMPADTFGQQVIHCHPVRARVQVAPSRFEEVESMAVSPNNARIRIDPSGDFSSFYLASELPGGRACACFTLLVHNEGSAQGRSVEEALSERNVQSFLQRLQRSPLDAHLLEQITSLLTFQRTYTSDTN